MKSGQHNERILTFSAPGILKTEDRDALTNDSKIWRKPTLRAHLGRQVATAEKKPVAAHTTARTLGTRHSREYMTPELLQTASTPGISMLTDVLSLKRQPRAVRYVHAKEFHERSK